MRAKPLRIAEFLLIVILPACSDGPDPSVDAMIMPECTRNSDCLGYSPLSEETMCVDSAECIEGTCQARIARDCSFMDDPDNCRVGQCDYLTGECAQSPINSVACDDGNVCTTDDTCDLMGVCVGGPPPSCPETGPCQIGSCEPARGCVTERFPVGTACDDGDPCTAGDMCNGSGGCISWPRNCDDDNPCTVDTCGVSGCENVAVAVVTPCNDGDPCTSGDTCAAETCRGTPVGDGGPCFDSVCMTGTTCTGGVCGGGTPLPNGEMCEEDFACVETMGICVDGTCAAEATVCPDDGNPCTDDVCTPGRGCLYLPTNEDASCESTACATGGTCDNGLCVGATLAPDGASCDTGSTCATGETCLAGGCGGGDASLCVAPDDVRLLVTDNAAGQIAALDAFGSLVRSYPGEFLGPSGVAYDGGLRDGFFVTYSGVGGVHTYYKLGWDGANLPDVVHQGSYPLVAVCNERIIAGGFLVSTCGNRITHDRDGNFQFAGPNVMPDVGIVPQGATSYWLLTRTGLIHDVFETLGGIQRTFEVGLPGASGFDRVPYGFLVGYPTYGFVVQTDRDGRFVRTIPLPTGTTMFDLSSVPAP